MNTKWDNILAITTRNEHALREWEQPLGAVGDFNPYSASPHIPFGLERLSRALEDIQSCPTTPNAPFRPNEMW